MSTDRWRSEAEQMLAEWYRAKPDERLALQGAAWAELVDAILRLVERVEPQWLPIETAPKDGRAVLGYNGVFTTVVWWRKGLDREYWELVVCGSYADDAEWNPTHWMALPDPPGAVAASPSGERTKADVLREHIDVLRRMRAPQHLIDIAERVLAGERQQENGR